MATLKELDPKLPLSERLFILSSLAHKEGRTQEGHELGAAAQDALLQESTAAHDREQAMIHSRGRER